MGETDQQGQLVPTSDDALVVSEQDAEIAQLRASIEITRERITHALDDVQDGMREKFAWREWVKENPYKSVGIAFGVGYLLGRI